MKVNFLIFGFFLNFLSMDHKNNNLKIFIFTIKEIYSKNDNNSKLKNEIKDNFYKNLKNITQYNYFICLVDNKDDIKSYSILEDLDLGHVKLQEINSIEKFKGYGSILFYNLIDIFFKKNFNYFKFEATEDSLEFYNKKLKLNHYQINKIEKFIADKKITHSIKKDDFEKSHDKFFLKQFLVQKIFSTDSLDYFNFLNE